MWCYDATCPWFICVSDLFIMDVYVYILIHVKKKYSLRSSILSILVYAQFLRMRYYMSSDTRQFLTHVGTKIDSLLTPPTAHPKIPPAVIKAYATAKEKMAPKTL